jgi:Mlc titration factor MtfA (ptsG expression regulator)
VNSANQGQATLLDQYGASNRAEFFAVASECFFCRPRAMRGHHPELYELLRVLYGQDPATWTDDDEPA